MNTILPIKITDEEIQDGLKKGMLICSHASNALDVIPEGKIDLIYADPPYFSGSKYDCSWDIGLEKKSVVAFEDMCTKGFYGYLNELVPILKKCYRVLKPNGSMFLQLDYHAVHYVKIEMDKIFGDGDPIKGMRHYRNDIVWKRYGGVKNNATKKLSVQIDNILYYVKGKDFTFNMQYMPLSKKHIEKEYKYKDDDGRIYAKSRGRSYQLSGGTTKKLYLDETKGRPITNLWDEEGLNLNTSSSESLGYDTQKPEALLERIIEMSSNPDDVLLDPFCGSGTSLTVASFKGRVPIGIDEFPGAIATTKNRVPGVIACYGLSPEELINAVKKQINHSEHVERLRHGITELEFQQWAVLQLGGYVPCLKGSGIDGIIPETSTGIEVKQEDVTGIQWYEKLIGTLQGLNLTNGIIVGFSFSSGIIKRAEKDRNLGIKPSIQLLTALDIVEGRSIKKLEEELHKPKDQPLGNYFNMRN